MLRSRNLSGLKGRALRQGDSKGKGSGVGNNWVSCRKRKVARGTDFILGSALMLLRSKP